MCDDCRTHWRNRRARIKTVFIYGGKCEDCGLEDVRVLQLHHVNGGGSAARRARGEKEGTRLMRIIAKSGSRDPELDLLCANCHLIRHWNDRWDPE